MLLSEGQAAEYHAYSIYKHVYTVERMHNNNNTCGTCIIQKSKYYTHTHI